MRDTSEFDQFYAATATRLVGQLYAMVGDLGEAEDAVQEAFARAWQRWRRVGSYADPTAWVRTVAYRIAVSSWRRTRVRTAAHARWGDNVDRVRLDPDTIVLVDALRRISPDQRRAIVLFHLGGLPVKAIAEETGSTVAAVKTRLSRGRRALAPILGIPADGPDPGDPGGVDALECLHPEVLDSREVDHSGQP